MLVRPGCCSAKNSPIDTVTLAEPDYDTDVLIIGGGGAGCAAAIEAHNNGAKVTVVTKLRMGDANTMMAEGGIQAADKDISLLRRTFSTSLLTKLRTQSAGSPSSA